MAHLFGGIFIGAVFVAFSLLAGRALQPLTREQMSDLPRGFYVAERVSHWLMTSVGLIFIVLMLIYAIGTGLGY